MLRALSILIISSLFISCGGEKESTKSWYKGNLHTHTYWSDGDEFPERVMDWYKSEGYHFLALSDHNILAEGEKWKTIPDAPIYQAAFDKYLQEYGSEWVNFKRTEDTLKVQLKTFAEFAPRFDEEGRFLMIRSEEITDKFEEKHIHLNATNIQSLIPPQGGASVTEVMQNNIDAVAAQREATGEPIMVHINHPNFFYSISAQDIIGLKGERFFEVYNGHPIVNNLGDSTHIGMEEMWDAVNVAYTLQGKPLIFGLATDDSHNYHVDGKEWSTSGRGWVMVQTDSLHAHALIESMERGDFYSSTGIQLSELVSKENKIEVEVEAELGVEYEIEFIGQRKGAGQSELAKSFLGSTAHFDISEEWEWVRSKISSNKVHPNPVIEGEFEMAWTQPLRFQEQ